MKQDLVEGEDYYLNEEGLLVFTEKFLLGRGYCCGSGCTHCPYDYEAVPQPKRSYLREKGLRIQTKYTNRPRPKK